MTRVAVLTVFKDEGHIIREWCLHNLNLGFDHIYMINNNSSDNYQNIISDLNSDKITLLHDTRVNQQINIIRENYSKIKSLYDWIFITDLDEFLYFNDYEMTLRKFLNSQDSIISYIKIQWTVFILQQFRQPKSIVNSNTISLKTNNFLGKASCKCFYRTTIKKNMISVHGCVGDKMILKKYRKLNNNTSKLFEYKNLHFKYYLASDNIVQINHYCYQSLEFLLGVKLFRGGGNFNDTKWGGSKWMKFIKKKNFLGIKLKKINPVENNKLKKKNHKINEIIKKYPQVRPRVDLYNNPLFIEIKSILKSKNNLLTRYESKEDILKFYNFISSVIDKLRQDDDFFSKYFKNNINSNLKDNTNCSDKSNIEEVKTDNITIINSNIVNPINNSKEDDVIIDDDVITEDNIDDNLNIDLSEVYVESSDHLNQNGKIDTNINDLKDNKNYDDLGLERSDIDKHSGTPNEKFKKINEELEIISDLNSSNTNQEEEIINYESSGISIDLKNKKSLNSKNNLNSRSNTVEKPNKKEKIVSNLKLKNIKKSKVSKPEIISDKTNLTNHQLDIDEASSSSVNKSEILKSLKSGQNPIHE